jgi:hypothetical protein
VPWRGPEEPGEFPTLGYLILDWIEDHLVITDGPKLGSPFELYPEQAMHVLNRYRLDPEATEDIGNDAFRYGGSQLVRGQKWGKDPILAALDLVHAFGPCDFAGWDADGEPVGKPHPSPWIFVVALNVDQANNTWLPLKAMLEASEFADLPGVDITLDQIRLPGGNLIEKLTTTAFGRLGGRFTAGSLTENSLMTATGEGGNTGKRSPLSFAQTLIRSIDGMQGMWAAAANTWDPTERSHAQLVYEAKDPHTYVDVKLSRKKVDLDDDDELRDELTYLYGDTLRENGGHQSLQRLTRSCRDKSKGESEIRRFFLSEILAGEEPLCTPERWAALDRSDPKHPEYDPLVPGEAITLGFDGSRSRDATVLTACRIRDGRLFHLRTWMPRCMCEAPDHRPEDCKNRKIPRAEVEQAADDAFAAYEVWYLYGDPYKWQETLENLAGKYPKRVLEVPTNVETRMDGMVERFTTARDAGAVTHNGHADLTAHVRDAVIAKGRRKPSKPRVDAHGKLIEHYLKVVKKREGVFIDAAISALLAFDARGQALEDGALADPKPAPAPIAIDDDELPDMHGPLDDLPDLNSIEF